MSAEHPPTCVQCGQPAEDGPLAVVYVPRSDAPRNRNTPERPPTCENVPSSPSGSTAFDKVEQRNFHLEHATVRLSLRDCALVAPLLELVERQYRRDGLRLSAAQLLVVARVVGAEARYKELATLCTVGEAARLLGVSQRRVRALVYRGHLDARQLGGRWLIEKASLMDRVSMMKAAAAKDLAPPAGELAARDPGVRNAHLRPFADPTANEALARLPEGPQQ